MLNDDRVEIITDDKNDLWNSCVKTLSNISEDVTHLLVLQDDILPCMDFVPTVERLIDLFPTEPLTFFCNKKTQDQARIQGVHYVMLQKWLMAQAYVMPVAIIKDFLVWSDQHIKPELYFDDGKWSMYLYYKNIQVRATAPSLVEHLGWNETTLSGYQQQKPTTVGSDGSIINVDTLHCPVQRNDFDYNWRMARWFIGFENSATDINWENTAYLLDRDTAEEYRRYYKD